MRFFNDLQGCSGATGASLLISRRAHLLTTCKASGGMPMASCALRGGCVFCGSRWARFFLLRRAYPCLRRMPVCFLWAVLLPACAACSGQIFRRDRRSAPPISYNAKLLVNEVNGNRNYPFEISPPSERCCWVLLKPRKPLKIRQFIHAKAL